MHALGSQPAAAAAAAASRRVRRWIRGLTRAAATCLLWLLITGMIAWGAGAIYFASLSGRSPRSTRAGLFVIASLAALLFARPHARLRQAWHELLAAHSAAGPGASRPPAVARCRAALGLLRSVAARPSICGLAIFGLGFAAILGWFLRLQPSNDRQWAPDVARTTSAVIDGDLVTVHNLRNFDYRSDADFTPRWEDRTYDLSELRSVDLILCFWGPKAVAHGMVSFGFGGGNYLCVSVETRKERFESFSAVQGFFRQYELIYVFGDERDLVRVRCNYRNEDVYLYRSTLTPAEARRLFLRYLGRANALHVAPEWYNAATSNCITNVWALAREDRLANRLSWRLLLSGHAMRQAYANGKIDTSMPYEVLEARSRINAAAARSNDAPDFSERIRADLPAPPVK